MWEGSESRGKTTVQHLRQERQKAAGRRTSNCVSPHHCTTSIHVKESLPRHINYSGIAYNKGQDSRQGQLGKAEASAQEFK
jgi:hypothetical protein